MFYSFYSYFSLLDLNFDLSKNVLLIKMCTFTPYMAIIYITIR